MIFVDGKPFNIESSSSNKGADVLNALMECPFLVSATNSFKGISEMRFTVSAESGVERSTMSKWVYVFQKEYATVNPAIVDENNHITGSGSRKKMEGYSFPLCYKIIKSLWTRPENFHLQTLCILQHNTRRDSEGNAYPIFNGLAVKTSDGSVFPASFDSTSRCPDEVVRRIRLSSSYEDPNSMGRLLEAYETQTDQFKIEPFRWSQWKQHMALSLQHLSDSEILQTCSTSPYAEGPDFVENERRQWAYIVEHPDWRETFPKKKPRIFTRAADGRWERCFN